MKTLLKILPFIFALHELEEWNTLAWHQKYQLNVPDVPDVTDIHLQTIFVVLIIFSFIFTGRYILRHTRQN